MFIDIHAHSYLWPCPKQDGNVQFSTPEQVLEEYDRQNIEKGILLPLIGPECYLPQSNEQILEICRRFPNRFIPFCNIDPRALTNSVESDFSYWLSWYKDQGCKGVGEFMPNMPFSSPLVQNFFKHVEAAELPLIFDISDRIGGVYGLYDDPGLPQLERCLQKFSRLPILGHGMAFWAEIGQIETPADRGRYPQYPIKEEGVVPKLFRRYENMWGDLSAGSAYCALTRDAEFAANFLTEFQDRLCFGTDICAPKMKVFMSDFLITLKNQGKISNEVFAKVAKGNAIKLLKLQID